MVNRRTTAAQSDPFSLTDFRWDVCRHGYEWRASLEKGRRGSQGCHETQVLVPRGSNPDVRNPADWEPRYPLRTADLYRRFARLGTDRDAIRAFADEFGLLTTGTDFVPSEWDRKAAGAEGKS